MICVCVALYLYTRIQFAMQACTKMASYGHEPTSLYAWFAKIHPGWGVFFMCLEYLFLTGCVPPMENLGILQGMNR